MSGIKPSQKRGALPGLVAQDGEDRCSAGISVGAHKHLTAPLDRCVYRAGHSGFHHAYFITWFDGDADKNQAQTP
jgi:hypothetical protein